MSLLQDVWVIVDGDNTLWNTEPLYDSARSNLCQLLSQLGFDAAAVDSHQRAVDADLHASLGYSPARFPRSFVCTLEHFVPNPPNELRTQVARLGEAVFTSAADVCSGVDAALTLLGTRFKLALLTAGDEEVQKSRVSSFGRASHFKHVSIVPSKDVSTLRALLDRVRAPPQGCWAIGDSLRSDVYPAIALGLRAVHIRAPNWHPIERGDLETPAGVEEVSSFSEAVEVVMRLSEPCARS